MNYLDLTIAEMHQAIIDKKVTPEELVKEAIKRAKENKDNAFEMICEEEAYRQVQELKEVEVDNPLWGIPFVLKDNFSTKGIETTAGSNILNGYVPLFDSTVYEKLREHKAILIGKATLDELAMGGTGTTGHKGITYNPYDPSHIHLIGGSSCGSAASVCASIVPFSLGSDTGDSVRKPASFSGLVGFKPTWGRISRFGLFPFAPSLDHVGYFTRSVEDATLLLDVLAGRDDKDATSSTEPVLKYEDYLSSSIKGKKIAVIKEIMESISDKKIVEEFDKSVEYLKKCGAFVDIISIDRDLLNTVYPTYIIISCAEATSNDANLDGIKFGPRYPSSTYQGVMKEARTRGFCELIKRRFVIGSFALMRENQDVLFLRAQKNRRYIVDTFNKLFEKYDGYYVPSGPTTAPLFKQASDKLSATYLIADNHLAIGNFGGYPSITLPLGFSNSLPFGATLTCKPMDEASLFSIAKKIEEGTGLYNLKVGDKQ